MVLIQSGAWAPVARCSLSPLMLPCAPCGAAFGRGPARFFLFISAVRAWAHTAFIHGAWAPAFPSRSVTLKAHKAIFRSVLCAPSRHAPRTFLHSAPRSVLSLTRSVPSPFPLRSHAARALPPACGKAAAALKARRRCADGARHTRRSRAEGAPRAALAGGRRPVRGARGARPPGNQKHQV